MKWFSNWSGQRPFEMIRAHKLVSNILYICGTEDDARRLIDTLGVIAISADVPPDYPKLQRLNFKREYMRRLTEEGEWYGVINDNVGRINCLPSPQRTYHMQSFESRSSLEWRNLYATDASSEVMTIAERIILKCKEAGSIVGGIGGPTDNYFHRKYQWNKLGFVRGDFFVAQNAGFDLNPSPELATWDDWHLTLLSLKHGGASVNYRYASVVKPEYEPGGLGPEEERTASKIRAARYLVDKFSGLVELNGRPDSLRIVPRGQRQLATWRKDNL